VAFLLRRILQKMIGAAIISIAAGQGIGTTYRALVMTMYMHQLNQVSAEQALLGLHGLKIRIFISIKEERRKRERKVKDIPFFSSVLLLLKPPAVNTDIKKPQPLITQ
jgi:hypothetical protein